MLGWCHGQCTNYALCTNVGIKNVKVVLSLTQFVIRLCIVYRDRFWGNSSHEIIVVSYILPIFGVIHFMKSCIVTVSGVMSIDDIVMAHLEENEDYSTRGRVEIPLRR